MHHIPPARRKKLRLDVEKAELELRVKVLLNSANDSGQRAVVRDSGERSADAADGAGEAA